MYILVNNFLKIVSKGNSDYVFLVFRPTCISWLNQIHSRTWFFDDQDVSVCFIARNFQIVCKKKKKKEFIPSFSPEIHYGCTSLNMKWPVGPETFNNPPKRSHWEWRFRDLFKSNLFLASCHLWESFPRQLILEIFYYQFPGIWPLWESDILSHVA